MKVLKPARGDSLECDAHALICIQSGEGPVAVDFRTYPDLSDKVFFVSPGQLLGFGGTNLSVLILEFPEEIVHSSRDYRVLFKHLISPGYVEPEHDHRTFISTIDQSSPAEILDISTSQWYSLNPFHAGRDEYQIIFDMKDAIDTTYRARLSIEDIIDLTGHSLHTVHRVLKGRIGLTAKDLLQKKLLVESQREIALTDKPIKEIAYDLGFSDHTYFHRFFKHQSGQTPNAFRHVYANPSANHGAERLMSLIQKYHTTHRSIQFYAQKMYLSTTSLSRLTRTTLNTTVGALVRAEIIRSAKMYLSGLSVQETAHALGFEEANHFSAYFKKYTGMTPTAYRLKMSNSET